jgi:hypothetical protein
VQCSAVQCSAVQCSAVPPSIGTSLADVEEMVRLMDRDGDGRVSFTEYSQAFRSAGYTGAAGQEDGADNHPSRAETINITDSPGRVYRSIGHPVSQSVSSSTVPQQLNRMSASLLLSLHN